MSSCCCCSSNNDSNISSVASDDDDVYCCMFNCTKKDLVKSGFYCTKLFDNIICCGCGWQSGDVKLTIQHVNFLHKLSKPDCVMSNHVTGDFCNYLKYKQSVKNTENIMMDTFARWPKLYPNIEDLVNVGFYYTGVDDDVACISCGVTLNKWAPDDKPLEEHKKASPYCKLLNI